jgi:hypothetical protein
MQSVKANLFRSYFWNGMSIVVEEKSFLTDGFSGKQLLHMYACTYWKGQKEK